MQNISIYMVIYFNRYYLLAYAIIYISLHIFIHYNCKNSVLSVTVVPEIQLDKPDVDDGFELVLNRKQEDKLQYSKMGDFQADGI